MKKINLAISGCMGRMGQQLIKSARKKRIFRLVSLTENRKINKKISGIKPELNSINSFKKANIIIDFTIPKCTLEILKIASKQKKRVVIGTTGFTKKEENLIKKFSKKIPILKAGNMSLGVNLLMFLTEVASRSLGEKFLSKVYEVHHKYKKDYPSGTALMLGRGIHNVVLYFFSLIGLLFSRYCQYRLIAALAFPVLVLDNQCKEGEAFFEVIILTTSPFLNIDCKALSFPFISHLIAASPICVCTA